jgi:DNA-binding NarL/FixJ family response regulator
MNDSIVKVAIVDDHAIVRAGLKQFLSEMVDLRVVGEASSGREAIDLVRTTEMDVIIMDLSMPGQSGIDALAMIRAKAPDVGILILSGYPEEQYAVNLIRQGASGYLNKECEPMEIVNAIRTIALGRTLHLPLRGGADCPTAQSQGRQRRARPAVRARIPGFPQAGQGRNRRRHRQRLVAQRQDRQHLSHAPDGKDGPHVQQ